MQEESLLARVDRKLDEMDRKMDEHVKDSMDVYVRVAILETKVSTVSKVMWGMGGGLVTVGGVVVVKMLDVV